MFPRRGHAPVNVDVASPTVTQFICQMRKNGTRAGQDGGVLMEFHSTATFYHVVERDLACYRRNRETSLVQKDGGGFGVTDGRSASR